MLGNSLRKIWLAPGGGEALDDWYQAVQITPRYTGETSPFVLRAGTGKWQMENKALIDDQEPGRPGLVSMVKFKTVGLRCDSVAGIQIIRENTPGGFSVRVTLYGKADTKIADRAVKFVQREKRRHFHLIG